MNNLIKNEVLRFLEEYTLNLENKTFLVAFSGGYDSTCLLHALISSTKNRIIAIHLNHGWRGKESDDEELKCRSFCESCNIEFYSEKLSADVKKTETAARDARYDFFKRCAEKFNTDIVFTAHNADDNAETVLYRIIKGTAIDGLSGILPKRDIYYRPLLGIKRRDIEEYCSSYSLTPNNDSSNKNIKFNRNFIRHEIMPLIKKINPDCVDSINSLSDLARLDSDFLNEQVKIIGYSTQKFVSAPAVLKTRVVKNLLVSAGLDYDREKLEQLSLFICDNADSKSGKITSLSANLELFVNNKYFEIISDNNNTQVSEVSVLKEGSYKFLDGIFTIEKCNTLPPVFPSDNEFIAYINTDNINFVLRTRKDGDIISPLGSSGKQKLKKYLNEKKIPQYQKNFIPLLAKDKEIFWVAGIGLSDKIKVTNKVSHIIKYEMESR